jgi:replicative DNA helicase
MAHGAVQQDKQQVPHADNLGSAAADETNEQTRPSHGVAVFEHRFDAVLDASSTIIMIEMPFLRLRGEMGKLRKAMDKASVEYDQEQELYASMMEELTRFDITLSSTVELFTMQDERKARTLAECLGRLLGLYNTVKLNQIEVKEDSTREGLKTALVHLNAMDLHEEKSIGEVIDKLEDTRSMIFRSSKARQAKDSWHKVLY